MAEQKKKSVAAWEQALRRTLKSEHGTGWSLRQSRGRAQLVQILAQMMSSLVLRLERSSRI